MTGCYCYKPFRNLSGFILVVSALEPVNIKLIIIVERYWQSISHLEYNVNNDDQDRKTQVKQQPDLHRLDVGGAGEAGGDGQVDRGQDHHAGDVDGVDKVVFGVSGDVVRGLVDDVHQDGGQVGHHEDAVEFPGQNQPDLHKIPQGFI